MAVSQAITAQSGSRSKAGKQYFVLNVWLSDGSIGSGITLYNVVRFPLNVTATIDGIPSQSYLHNLFSCNVPDPEHNRPTCYGHPTINLQCLAYGNHVLELALVGYNSSQSDFYLDSVDVNMSKSRCGQKKGLQR